MGSSLGELDTEAPIPPEADVRAAFLAAVAKSGGNYTQASRNAGIAYGTLMQWKDGTYSGNNDRITREVHRWLQSLEVMHRRQFVMPKIPGFITTPTADAILDMLEIAQATQTMAIFSGGAGIGKTITAQFYQKRVPNCWLMTMNPAINTLTSCLREVANAIGEPSAANKHTLSRFIGARLAGRNGLIIVDEAQHMDDMMIDMARSYYDSPGVGIALIGNETVIRRFSGEKRTEANAPLHRRFSHKMTRQKLTGRDLTMLVDGWALDDEDAKAAAKAVGRMPGAAGIMKNVLVNAFLLSQGQGRLQPSKADIETAWAQLADRPMGRAA